MSKSSEGYQSPRAEVEGAVKSMDWDQELRSQIREERTTDLSEAQRKLYSFDNLDGRPFELDEETRIKLLEVMREAGKNDVAETSIFVSGDVGEFIGAIMFGQDHYRIQSLLIEAFEYNADQYRLGLSTSGSFVRPKRELVIYNRKYEKPVSL